MTPLHSLVDGLRIKNKCHQREDVTLRPWYLSHIYDVKSPFLRPTRIWGVKSKENMLNLPAYVRDMQRELYIIRQ